MPLSFPHASKLERLHEAISHLNIRPEGFAGEGSFAQALSLDEFREMSAVKPALIVDTRPEAFHALGRVPGAISLPRETFAASFVRNESLLERHMKFPVLLYCSGGECEDSHLVAAGLQRLGYTELFIFTGGWNEWREMGLSVER